MQINNKFKEWYESAYSSDMENAASYTDYCFDGENEYACDVVDWSLVEAALLAAFEEGVQYGCKDSSRV